MSIANFVAGAIDEHAAGRYDVALALACAAVDATARRDLGHREGNANRFKDFLERNMRVVLEYGFPGISAAGLHVGARNLPGMKTAPNGTASIAAVIYHVVRCGLLHECLVDDAVEFVPRTQVGDCENKFRLPQEVTFGLLVAVVISPVNTDQVLERRYVIRHSDGSRAMSLQDLWGVGPEAVLRGPTSGST